MLRYPGTGHIGERDWGVPSTSTEHTVYVTIAKSVVKQKIPLLYL